MTNLQDSKINYPPSHQSDLVELRETIAFLQFQNEELEGFSHALAHDLRAPLKHMNNLITMILLDRETQLSAKAQQLAKNLQEQNGRLLRLVNAMRAISRQSFGEIEFTHVAIEPLIHEICAQYDGEFHSQDIEIKIGALPMVHANPELIWQLFDNLIRNAMAHGGVPLHLEIFAERRADWLRIIVENNLAAKDRLYDQAIDYFNGRQSSGSTGLGLKLCEKIIKLHQARISAMVKAEKFRVTLEFKETENA